MFDTLRVFLWDADAANQGLEALILAQAVKHRLDFEVDHLVVALLEAFVQPIERALFIADPDTCHGREHRWRIPRLCGFLVILYLAPPISLCAVLRHRPLKFLKLLR